MAVCIWVFKPQWCLSGASDHSKMLPWQDFHLEKFIQSIKMTDNGLDRWHTHVYKHPKAHMNTPICITCEHIHMYIYYIHIKTTKQLQRCHWYQTQVPTSWWQLPSEQLCRGDKTDHTTLAKSCNTSFLDSGNPFRCMTLSTHLFVLPFGVRYFLKSSIHPSLRASDSNQGIYSALLIMMFLSLFRLRLSLLPGPWQTSIRSLRISYITNPLWFNAVPTSCKGDDQPECLPGPHARCDPRKKKKETLW